MLNHIKTYESFIDAALDLKPEDSFFGKIGSNLVNLISDQMSFIAKMYGHNIDSDAMKGIKNEGVNISSEEIRNILNEDMEERVKRLKHNRTDSIGEIKKEFEAYFHFIHYMITNTRLDIQRVLKEDPEAIGINKRSLSYDVFDLSKINSLHRSIDKLWKKMIQKVGAVGKNAQNIELIKKGALGVLEEQHSRWINFFSDDDWKKYQVKEIPKAKKDPQQIENEGIIQQEEEKYLQQLTPEEKNSPFFKALLSTAPVSLAITPEYKARFSQRNNPGAGSNNMKGWFLKMFLQAEKNYGRPFKRLSSGYRTKEYQEVLRKNPGIKAAKNSPHVQGVAADIDIRGENKQKIIDSLKAAGFNRFGIGKSFIHVDAADKVNPKTWVPYARWSYNY